MINIENYDEGWPKIYESEKIIILNAVEQWIKGIEHVGSTSIPYIAAKPTIDICIGVTSLTQADKYIITVLKKFNYEYIQALESDIPDRRYLQKLSCMGEHLFHIHIVVINGNLWNNYIRFRDYLITHPEVSQAYMALKHMLKVKFFHDREAYTEGKSDFIKNVLEKAVNLEKNNS